MEVLDAELRKEGGWAKSFVKHKKYKDGREFPYHEDFRSPMMAEADVIVISSYMHESEVKPYNKKPITRHYSTEPHRWLVHPDPQTSTVVAQYQARFAPPGVAKMPNCIPINSPMFTPGKKPDDRIIVVYTPSSRAKVGWSNKGFDVTVKALASIARSHGEEVEIFVLENASYEDVMRARRHAHIVIDECATGSYHSCSLEGMACGAATICWMDNDTRLALASIMPDDAMRILPLELIPLSRLEQHLHTLVQNPGYTKYIGQTSREWMEKWYSENFQASIWINWLRNFQMRFGRN